MRHDFQITITDVRGARHYTLTQVMRRAGLVCAALALLVFLGCLLVIQLLSARVDRMDERMAALHAENAAIEARNADLLAREDALRRQVDVRARELIALTDDLEQLETLVGIETPPALPIAERISVASHTAFEKNLLLSSIPSGTPLDQSVVTSSYGMRDHPVVEGSRLHGGVDLRASIGTLVRATADGVVEFAGNNPGSGMGKMIKIVHNYGFSTIFAHLDEVDVEVGQYVTQGESIGRSGNTGLSEAPHLHYEVRYLERRLNPAPFMDWSFSDYRTVFEQEKRVQWQSLARTVRSKLQVMDRQSSPPAPSLSAISP